ncbi:MAG: SDR family NAD(P)-dependent oxidoreductase [Solirubrobacterales bacterium]|nr:SDR family NAD(P)-dependent oxidoreductase [Solirubrobacterales bacterium]
MSVTSVVDTALDRTIVLGYGNVGLAIRRRLSGWPADPPRIDGSVVMVTGAASGLGRAAAAGLAGLGARVYAVARDDARAAEAVDRVRATVARADVRPLAADLSEVGELRDLARRFAAQEPRLDVLVNNAGAMPDEREHSAGGHELMFATHVLAPFALTELLAEQLKAARPSRVINVSSGGMYDQSVPVTDLESEDASYGPKKLYARTKRELVVITEQWAERLKPEGVVVHAMHPGWVDTKGVQDWMPVFRAMTRPIIRTPEQGADTIAWLGASPEPLRSTGLFWHDRRPRPTTYLIGASADDADARAAVWEHCRQALDRPDDPVAAGTG